MRIFILQYVLHDNAPPDHCRFTTSANLLKMNNMYETIQEKPDLYPFGRDLLDFTQVVLCTSAPLF